MDTGRRTFLLYQPGSAGGVVTAARGSSLSSLSMSPLSSTGSDDRGSAARLGDWPRTDIDWTVKYLTSDQPRTSPVRPLITGRISGTSDDIFLQRTCKSHCPRFISLKTTQPSILSVRWQNEYQLSGSVIINGDGGCSFLAAYRRASGSSPSALSKGRQPSDAVLHSSREPGELSQ